MTKSYFIKSFGCQMNVYDGERMADLLGPLGYAASETPEAADLVVLNTCHIREKAAEKVYSELGRLRDEKARRAPQGRKMTIAVAGCVAQAEGEEIARRAPAVDLIFGPQVTHRLPTLLAERERSGKVVLDTDFPVEDKFALMPPPRRRQGPSAFLTVQEGCDKFCAFCVVPYTRGAENSRGVAAIEEEARRLVGAGAVEITLLGQNVNAFRGEGEHGQPTSLADLVDRLARIEGLRRIRYTTSHPLDMSDDLIRAHRDNDKLMPYLHLPVQAGADRILKAMNRKHTSADYLRLVDRARAARPDIALSSDFIVGFPGETDKEFAATLALVRAVGFAHSYSFKYSPRPGTPAASLEDQIEERVKAERLQRLQAALGETAAAFNRATVGKTLPVLIERPGKREGHWTGRTPYLQTAHLKGAAFAPADIVDAFIVSAESHSLTARPAPAQSMAAE